MDELSGAVENCFDGRWEKSGASLEPTEGAGTLLGTRSLMIEGRLLNNISTGYIRVKVYRANANIRPKMEIKQSKSPTHLVSVLAILLVFDSSPKSEESRL